MRVALYIVALSVAICGPGCTTRSPYPMYYQCTAEGLKPLQPAQRHLVQRCTPEALEARTNELLTNGYVIIGKAVFASDLSVPVDFRQGEAEDGQISPLRPTKWASGRDDKRESLGLRPGRQKRERGQRAT
jgi:hypothetical protein